MVGQTPILQPGDCFQYYSSTMLPVPRGQMRGSFQMYALKQKLKPQEDFDALIDPFKLIASSKPKNSIIAISDSE